ncbi:hypothetical protein ACWC10_15510 [Streptomyces sp. NPDC001595]|uniref:hypothetical protein n=1 Tax=Streptomyces sp. NPDC001532 TaxID=3154520 RepID=UPI00331EF7CC
MDEHREEEPGRGTPAVPRDLPDQQAREDEDPWDVPTGPSGPKAAERPRAADTDTTEDGAEPADVPDIDEAGGGRKGGPQTGTVHPEHPAPDESTG